MADPQAIAEAFVDKLKTDYATNNLPGIGALYAEDSSYTAEGTTAVGPAGIFEFFKPRFSALPAGTGVNLRFLSKADAQMTHDNSKLLIMVTGDSSMPPTRFTEVFLLAPSPSGSFYLKGEILRFMPTTTKPFNTEKDPGGFGASFAQNYYKTYNENPAGLAAVYREESQLIFEGQYAKGMAAIGEKLSKMPRGSHALETLDIVPFNKADGSIESIVVMVTGKITLEGQTNPLAFAQVFNLVPDAATGSVFISNELYRFVYG